MAVERWIPVALGLGVAAVVELRRHELRLRRLEAARRGLRLTTGPSYDLNVDDFPHVPHHRHHVDG